MAKKLKNLVIENVGLVDRGANQLADMAIWKRAPSVKVGESITVGRGAQTITLQFKERTNA